MGTLPRRAQHRYREREMATLRSTCEHAGRAAGRFSFCRMRSATQLHVSLPDSLASQAITAPPAYTFRLDSSQESAKTKTAAFT